MQANPGNDGNLLKTLENETVDFLRESIAFASKGKSLLSRGESETSSENAFNSWKRYILKSKPTLKNFFDELPENDNLRIGSELLAIEKKNK